MPNHAKPCQTVPNYAKPCQTMPKPCLDHAKDLQKLLNKIFKSTKLNATAIPHKSEDMTLNSHFRGKFRGKKFPCDYKYLKENRGTGLACKQDQP